MKHYTAGCPPKAKIDIDRYIYVDIQRETELEREIVRGEWVKRDREERERDV